MFNPINPANFSKIEKDGADAASARIYMGNFTDLELVINPREEFDSTNFGARFRTNVAEFDLSALAGYFDKEPVVGGDFAGNLFDAGVRGEILYGFANEGDDYINFILGADYQLTDKLYGLIEYHHNGEGTKNKLEYFALFSKLMKGNIQALSTDYVAVMGNYLLHPLVSISGNYTANLVDGSGYAGLTGAWSAMENMNVKLSGMYAYGGNLSEFSLYPTAIYAMIEYYF